MELRHLRYFVAVATELIVSEYRRHYPGVEITAESGSTAHNVERLSSGARTWPAC